MSKYVLKMHFFKKEEKKNFGTKWRKSVQTEVKWKKVLFQINAIVFATREEGWRC